ncbi:MAG TPA: TonB-dependent receptor, partial [Gemmatimonadaceae bacterium]
VAERAPAAINRSSAAITRLTASDLARLPYATVADALRRVPGFAVIDFDGSGRDPQLMVRGFYGGGEAEYVVVMVDGVRVNQVHNGTIAWETLPPLSSIAAIEIVRGSASAAHGDAAVAGAINIVTRQAVSRSVRWHAGAETDGGVSGSAELSGFGARGEYRASLGLDRTDGYREHAARTAGTLRGMARLSRMYRVSARLSARTFDEPGPLLEGGADDGRRSDPRFQRDGGDDIEGEIVVNQDAVLGSGGTVRSAYRLDVRRADLVRTLPLTPEFGDTRERELRTLAGGVETQLDLTPVILPPVIDRANAGFSVNLGALNSSYFSEEAGARERDARGQAWRGALGAFLNVVARPADAVRWTLGIRADYLRDSFDPDGADGSSADHFAVSPKVGVNIRYASTGNFWIAGSGTFKSPTLDQLYDQRPVPVPFPPFTVTTSNSELEPQRGSSAEAGLYHTLGIGTAAVGLSATVYQLDMRNELDFDVQTLRYINIGRSRHRGAEVGLTVAQGIVTGQVSLSLQDVISRTGTNEGNQLKAVPGQVVSGGLSVAAGPGTLAATLTRMADMYLDDANTRRIPSWTRVDAQVTWPLQSVIIVAGARNLLDRQYSSSGFLDPAGSGQAYFYPAAGRVFTVGVRSGR